MEVKAVREGPTLRFREVDPDAALVATGVIGYLDTTDYRPMYVDNPQRDAVSLAPGWSPTRSCR